MDKFKNFPPIRNNMINTENTIKAEKNKNTFQHLMIKNAEKSSVYAGKRFLGLTPKGGEVWISME